MIACPKKNTRHSTVTVGDRFLGIPGFFAVNLFSLHVCSYHALYKKASFFPSAKKYLAEREKTPYASAFAPLALFTALFAGVSF